jgi:hypothetical protein
MKKRPFQQAGDRTPAWRAGPMEGWNMDHPQTMKRLVTEIESFFADQAKKGVPSDDAVNAKALAERLQDVFVIAIKGQVIDQFGPGDD